MRCLWLTRQEPFAANSGELIYSSGLMRALAASGASICMLGYDANESSHVSDPSSLSNISFITTGPVPQRRMKNFFSKLPSDADRLRSPKLRRELKQQLSANRFDALVIDHAALGWAMDTVTELGDKRRPKVVYVSHNCEAVIRKQIADHCQDGFAKRLAMQVDAKKYANLERRLCKAADLITAITPQDRHVYEQWLPGKPVIDLMPGYEGEMLASSDSPLGPDTPRRVLMVGSFEWIAKRHNLEALLAVANPVFQNEKIELQVVGKANPEYAREIESRFPCVRFHANVPAVEPYLQQARMGLIAETVGGGFKLKTLEYAFNRLPIAALKNALGGVEFASGQDAIVESTLPDLVRAIVHRIDDFEFLNQAAQATAEQFASRFRWSDRGAAFFNALRSLVQSSPTGDSTAVANLPKNEPAAMA